MYRFYVPQLTLVRVLLAQDTPDGREQVAFGQEGEQRAEPQAADQPITSAHHPLRKPPPSQPLVEPLSNRELDVLDLLAQRLSNKEIADKLYISNITIKSHLKNIYRKLNINKRREAVEKAMKIGIHFVLNCLFRDRKSESNFQIRASFIRKQRH